MERLTKLYDGEWCLDLYDEEAKQYSFHKPDEDGRLHVRVLGPAVDRLAAYEDTDLTPDGVELMKDALVTTQRYLHERFKSWNEANKEGRLVILPIKIGDKIYRIEKRGGVRILASHVVEKIEISQSGIRLFFGWKGQGYEWVRSDEIGRNVFLTPKEGEKVLKGENK